MTPLRSPLPPALDAGGGDADIRVLWNRSPEGGEMMSKVGKRALALGAAAAVLVVMAWFDTTIVRDAAKQGALIFDHSQYALVAALGMILSAGAVLLLALLAWRSRSVAVGVIYALVGAYLAFQQWIWMDLAGQINGAPPVLPYPLDSAVNHILNATIGPLIAVGIIGAGMLVAGVAVIPRSLRQRTGSPVGR
jgi:hypothetical protein